MEYGIVYERRWVQILQDCSLGSKGDAIEVISYMPSLFFVYDYVKFPGVDSEWVGQETRKGDKVFKYLSPLEVLAFCVD